MLTYFIYDGEDVIIDLWDEDGSGAGTAAVHRRYLHGPAIDQVLAQEDAANGVLWHLTDNLGSTRDLIESDGTLAAHFEYDSFGNLIDGRSQTTRYLFTGREYDHHSGLNYHRARWYDPHSGSWISEDPSGLGPDSNPYRYVHNSSVNFRDANGLEEIPLLYVQMDVPYGFPRGTLADLEAYHAAMRQLYAEYVGVVEQRKVGEFLDIASIVGKSIRDEQLETTCATINRRTAFMEFAGGFVPGIGEALDFSVLFDSGSSGVERLLAGGSLAANFLTAGMAPNFAVPARRIHKNSLDYVGETHVYVLRGPESAQGVRKGDGLSIRGQAQANALTRRTGQQYVSEVRKNFADKRSARVYETQIIERFRSMFGENCLPGNLTNR